MDIGKMTTQELSAYKAHLSDHLRELEGEVEDVKALLADINSLRASQGENHGEEEV